MRAGPLATLATLATLVMGGLTGCGYPTYGYVDPAEIFVDAAVDGAAPEDGAPPSDGCAKPNGCGGCNDQGVKGQRCEPCGRWVCSGTVVTCEPASPAVGTPCGACSTSTYACTVSGTTTCASPDDRTVYTDASYETKDQDLFALDGTSEAVVSYVVTRKVSYAEASFVLRRVPYACAPTAALPHPDPQCTDCAASDAGGFTCTVPTPKSGVLTYTLYEGTPATGLVPLGSGTVDAATVSASTAAFVTVAFPAEIPSRTIGTTVSIGISTDSSAHAFEVHGGDGTSASKPPTTTSWWRRTLTGPGAWGSWLEESSTDLAHVVRGKACAP